VTFSQLSSSALATPAHQTIVFVDAHVEDSELLINAVIPGVEVVRLNDRQDGIAQITAALAQRQNVAAVHLLSHGSPGQLQIGQGWVSAENLGQYAEQIRAWRRSLIGQAAFYLYGCRVAAEEVGKTFIQQLAHLTQATVAASQNWTGHAALGGDWDLEVATGVISAPSIFRAEALENYAYVLANIRIDDVIVEEGNSGTLNVTFTVSIDATSPTNITVDYAVGDNTATVADNDYTVTNATGTITFLANTTTPQTVTVQINGDTKFEADETFNVLLSNASVGHTITKARGIGLLLNDDSGPIFSISDAPPVVEGNIGTGGTATFTINRTGDTSQSSSISYVTASNTAIATEDFITAGGTLNFAAGEASKTITVNIIGDTLVEAGDQSFFVNLLNPVNALISDGQAVGTIIDDDVALPPPTLAIDNVSVNEGNSGATPTVTFTVTRSGDPNTAVSVDYSTADGTAIAPADYAPASGTLNFGAGITTQTFTVTINGDLLVEGNETFLVNLTNPVGATITTAQSIATITDDDTPPGFGSLAVNSISVAEGNSGQQRTATFTVTRSGDTGLAASVNYATADGTATAPDDYAATNGTLNFAIGETTKTFTVTVNGDDQVEGNHEFLINLTNPVNATIATAQGTGTITDDDTAQGSTPTISIDDISISEGNALTSTANFTVTLSAPSTQTVTVNYTTADGTATIANQDYVSTSGTLTFFPNETTKTIPVQVRGNLTVEPDETFVINLDAPVNATIADGQGTATITNDDTPPTISINDITVTEGNSGNTSANFTITLSAASSQTVSVQYQTVDGTATVADGDYTAIAPTFVTFNPGEISKTVTVAVRGDTKFEPNETLGVRLIQSLNASVAKITGTVTITNDDRQPTTTPPSNPPSGGAKPATSEITGTPGADNLSGTSRSEMIVGDDGDDTIRGLDGDDLLFGGNGNDQLFGGNGNDTLFGRDGKDRLFGDAGDDTLIGGFRNDVLTGGAGRDRFEFRREQQGIDRITDFTPADDTIAMRASDFKSGLKLGTLPEAQFHLGSKAADQSDRFIFNSATGELFFDADGSGRRAAILLARLGRGVTMTRQDIVLV
jgi:Ca2+-binding RTX toxin-like protein